MKQNKKVISKLIALAVSLCLTGVSLLAFSGCSGGGAQKISVGRAQWNYDIIQSNIMVLALNEHGYDASAKDVYDMGLMFAGVAEGSVDFYPDAWLPALQDSYLEGRQDSITVGGDLWGTTMPLTWTIPGYTAEEYNITSIEDLKGKGDIFGGKIYGYEAGTGGSEKSLAALEAYGLSDEYEFIPGSVPAMLAELKAKMQMNQAVMVVLWRPNPIFTTLDLQMLDDPLDIFGTNYCRYIANNDFVSNNPDIVHFLDNYRLELSDMEEMMVQNEGDGVSEEDLAQQWYNNHTDLIESWWP